MIVLGHEMKKILEVIPASNRITIVYNQEFAMGMSTSIRCGVKALSHSDLRNDACMICFGDMPYLTAMDYDQLISSFASSGTFAPIAIPTNRKGKRGNPVMFDKSYYTALANLPVLDKGAKSIIEANQSFIIEVIFDNDHIFKDIDFPE